MSKERTTPRYDLDDVRERRREAAREWAKVLEQHRGSASAFLPPDDNVAALYHPQIGRVVYAVDQGNGAVIFLHPEEFRPNDQPRGGLRFPHPAANLALVREALAARGAVFADEVVDPATARPLIEVLRHLEATGEFPKEGRSA